MAWASIIDDNFQRADTALGATQSTNVGNGWIDYYGNTWKITSNRLVGSGSAGGQSYFSFLSRPTSENQQDQRITAEFPIGFGGQSSGNDLFLRLNAANKTGYFCFLNYQGSLSVATVVNTTIGANLLSTTVSGYNNTHQYKVDFSVTGINPTLLTVVVTNLTTATVVYDNSFTPISNSLAALQTSGSFGVAYFPGPGHFARLTTYKEALVATAYELVGPANGTVGQPSTFTVSFPANTAGVAATITPSDSGGGGTFSPTTVALSNSITSATFTYTASSSGTSTLSTTNNASLTNPSSIAYSASAPTPATTYSITGAAGGTVGQAYTVTVALPAGTVVASLVAVSLSDNGGGGSLSSSTVQLTTGNSATVTYTSGTAGSKTISGTNDGGLTNPTPLGFTVSPGPTTIIPGDSSWFFSPYNWLVANNTAESNNPGAYFSVDFTGTSLRLNLDVSALVSASIAAASYPSLRWIVDDKSGVTQQLTASTTQLTLAVGLTAGTHRITVYFLKTNFSVSRWTGPASTIKITSLIADAGAVFSIPTLKSKRLIVYGDSITEGAYIISASFAGNDSIQNYSALLGQGLTAEYGQIGFSGQGWNRTGEGGVPVFPSTWDKYWSGKSRLVNGLLSPAPDYLVVCHGTNDGLNSVADSTVTSTVQPWLAAIRSAAGSSCYIFLVVSFGGFKRSAITAAFNNYQSSTPNSKTFLIDLGTEAQKGLTAFALGTNTYATDGIHPNTYGHAKLTSMIASAIQSKLANPATTLQLPGGVRSLALSL